MNPLIEKLGYSEEDRVVVIHADDVGINHASIEAYEELMALGTISCGSVMAHSPWLPEVIRRAKNHEEWDLGVHLAFNCEYETYRWRPLTAQKAEDGLIDENGYFKQSAQDVMAGASVAAIKEEMDAQINLVKDMGLDITHVDTHSGTLWHGNFVENYGGVIAEHDIFPVVASLEFMEKMAGSGLGGLTDEGTPWKNLAAKGLPFVDAVSGLPMDTALDIEERFELAKQMLLNLEPGKITHFAFHPMKDTEEARGLQRYTDARTGDYKVFIKPEMKEFLDNEAIKLVGYKEIREALGL